MAYSSFLSVADLFSHKHLFKVRFSVEYSNLKSNYVSCPKLFVKLIKDRDHEFAP